MSVSGDAIGELLQQRSQQQSDNQQSGDAIGELMDARRNDPSFASHAGDVRPELQYETGSNVRPLGATRPPTLAMVPDVQPASQRLGFGASFKVGFVDDPQTKLRLAAQSMFPDDPQAIRRFGFIDGRMVYVNDQGKLENVQGGVIDWLGGMTAQLPEMAGGIAGALVGSTAGPAGTVAGAAAGAAGAEGYKKVAALTLFGENQTALGNVGAMAGEAGLAAAGELIGAGVAAFRGRKAVRGLDNLDTATANAKRAAIRDATGIELDLAQVTNNPTLKAIKRWVANYPGQASEVIQASDELVAGQVDNAISRLLRVVSTEADTAAQGVRGINAARAAIDTAKAQVAARAAPLYGKAFAEGGEVQIAALADSLKAAADAAKGGQRTALRRALGYLYTGEGKKRVLDTSVEGLHAAKLAIDDMLEKTGSTAVGRTTRRELTQFKQQLVDSIAAASPTYDAARQVFAAESARLVDPLQNGIIGVLAKVEDRNAATAASRMFANGNVTPKMISQARSAIQGLEAADPTMQGAWNGIVRQWLSQNFVKASRELQTGEAINVAGKFRQAVIGTAPQKEAMQAALGGDALTLFNDIAEALQAVSRTPTSSSATAFNDIITERLSGGGSIIRAGMAPRQTIVAGIQERVLERNAMRIAEALTDPVKVGQLKALQGISDAEKRGLIAAGIIGVMSVGEYGNSLLFPPDTQLPPVLTEDQQR